MKNEKVLSHILDSLASDYRDVIAKKIKAKNANCFFEEEFWERIEAYLFRQRFEIEKFLDKQGLNEFCILSAFKNK